MKKPVLIVTSLISVVLACVFALSLRGVQSSDDITLIAESTDVIEICDICESVNDGDPDILHFCLGHDEISFDTTTPDIEIDTGEIADCNFAIISHDNFIDWEFLTVDYADTYIIATVSGCEVEIAPGGIVTIDCVPGCDVDHVPGWCKISPAPSGVR